MGMEGLISDMRAGKQRLQAKYLEAHAAAQQHFSDVAAVETAVQAACSPLEQHTQAQLTQSATSDRRWVLYAGAAMRLFQYAVVKSLSTLPTQLQTVLSMSAFWLDSMRSAYTCSPSVH